MATLTDLQNKRNELYAAIADYKQALADLAAGAVTQTDVDDAKVIAQTKGDEYAKLAGQVKKDNPGTAEDNFFSNPGIQSSVVRADVRQILRTGVLATPYLEMIFDTEGNTAGVKDIHLPFLSGTNVTVDWGDGTNSSVSNTGISHTYAEPGIYSVKIEGSIGGMGQVNSSRNRQLKDVANWGDVTIASSKSMFRSQYAFTISAKDAPKFLPGCDCSIMFAYALNFNSPIDHWDMSNVVDTSNMFLSARAFNQPLNAWNVSGVTNFDYMFSGADVFNQPLDQWDVSNVTKMIYMFNAAAAFDQDISTWDVSHAPTHTEFATNCPIDGTVKMPNFPV